MKKNITFVISFVLLLGCFMLSKEGYKLFGNIAGLIVFLLMALQTKTAVTVPKIITLLAASQIYGYMLGDGNPLVMIAFASSTLASWGRHLILNILTYIRFIFLDPLFSFLAIAIYFYVNTTHPSGWQGWFFPLIPLLFDLFISLLNWYDRFEIKKASVKGYIEVGKAAPEFTLPDQEGTMVNLSDFKGKRDLLLIFVRGDWCPGCHIMLRTYERKKQNFQEKNMVVMAIGPDPVGVNKEMVQKLGIDYKVLSDEKQETAGKFCVQLQGVHPPAKFKESIPLPASFLIDKKGIIRYTSRADRAGEILNPDSIFAVLEKL